MLKTSLRQLVAFAFLAVLAACAPATEKQYPWGVTPRYIQADTISPILLTTPAKPENKAEWKKQLDAVLNAQRTATQEQKALAKKEADFGLKMVTNYLPKTFTRTHYPQSFELLDKVGEDCIVITEDAKAYWNTPRPYLADKRIKTDVKPIKNGGYPSGHTSCGYVWMETAAQLLPEKREYLRAKARDIATHRLMVGMHMPQDVAGGKELGRLIVGALQMSDAYKADLKRAQMEVKQSRFEIK